MSTYPPPYEFDRKAARRAAVLQAKAVREQYRAQRELARAQARGLRRHSIVGPVIVVAIGVVALLVSIGRWPMLSFAAWYGRWWPALLVVAGLIMLAEWALDQYTAQTAPPGAIPGRRRVGGGIVVLILFLIFFGITSRTVHDKHDLLMNGLSLNQDNWFEVFGDKHSLPAQVLDEAVPQTFAAGTVLSIENPHGDISVTGKSPDGNLHVIVNKEVYATGAQGESKGDRLTPVFVVSGSTMTLTVPAVDGGSADLQVLAPETLAVTLNANHGAISVTGMKAAVTLMSNHGDVELRSVTGNVSAHVNHADSSFSAHTVTGDVTLRGKLGDVSLTDVSGQTNLEGDFYGSTHFERLKGPVTFQTSKTHFTVGRLDGMVDIDHSDISGSDLVGPVVLRVKSRNISFDRTNGDLDLQNSNGSVSVTGANPGNVTIDNTNGEVTLSMPNKAGFTMMADTSGGTIENGFGVPVTKVHDRSAMQGTVGDGRYHVSLQTTHADIRVNRFTPSTGDGEDKP